MKKRILSILMAACLLVTLLPAALAEEGPAWAGGAGSAEDPYRIATADQLAALAAGVNEGTDYSGTHFKLTADLDLENRGWTPIGGKGKPFKGVLDGGGHTVTNLTIHNTELAYAGLFGIVMTPGEVKNITLEDVSVTARSEVGALAGSVYTGTVRDVTVKGSIRISGYYKVGGLAGEGYARMENCAVLGEPGSTVTGTYKESDLEGDNVAGLVGYRGEGGIFTTGCRVSGLSILGTRKVGGLIGTLFCDNTVANCSVGNVTVATGAEKSYADSKATSMGVGGLFGILHTGGGNVGGAVSNCCVENVRLEKPADITAKMGYISGGLYAAVDANGNFPVPTADQLALTNVTAWGTNSGSTVPEGQRDMAVLGGERPVARAGDMLYTSVQKAVESVTGTGTVTLLGEVTENIVLGPCGRVTNVYLELAGHTLNGDISVGTGTTERWIRRNLYINEKSREQAGTVNGNITASGSSVNVKLYGGHVTGKVTAGGSAEGADRDGKVYIYSGCFTGGLETKGAGRLECYSGLFLHDPSPYVNGVNGYLVKKLDKPAQLGCTYQVLEDRVAEILRDGERIPYRTLLMAVNGAKDGETIEVLKDIDLKNSHPSIGKSVTLALNGHTVRGSHGYILYLNRYQEPRITVTVQNGALILDPPPEDPRQAGSAIFVNQRVDLTLDNVKVTAGGENAYGVKLGLMGANGTGLNPTVTVRGAESTVHGGMCGVGILNKNDGSLSGTLVVEDGLITGGWYGIAGNGSCSNTSITVNGGTVKALYSPDSVGIFHPQAGSLTVNGGVIKGGTGIEMRAGTLDLSGGTVAATSDSFEIIKNDSGSTSYGGGIVVSQHTTNQPVSVTVREGGKGAPVISGRWALYEADVQDDLTENVTLEIRGGEFISAPGAEGVFSENASKFISGGYFTGALDGYVKDGFAPYPSDKAGYPYKVEKKSPSTPADVTPAVGAPSVGEPEEGAAIPEGMEETVRDVAARVEADTGVLSAAAARASEVVTQAEKTQAKNALRQAGLGGEDEVHIYTQVYLAVTPRAYDTNSVEVTLDIVPMSRVVASTESDPERIVVEGEGDSPNAVALEEKRVDAITTIPITVTLPAGFVHDSAVQYYAKHTHGVQVHYYPLTMDGDKATFVNLHGFSTFTLPVKDPDLVASIAVGGGAVASYASFHDAVNAAREDQVVTVHKAPGVLTLAADRDVTVTNAANGPITVFAYGETVTIKRGETVTFSYAEYTISHTQTGEGTVEVSHERAAAGSEITVTAEPAYDYQTRDVTYTVGEDATVYTVNMTENEGSFTMPRDNVKVHVTFEKVPVGPAKPSVPTYPITVTSGTGGTVTAGVKRAAKGSTVTLTVTPYEGYFLKSLTATDDRGKTLELTDKGEGKFTFRMGESGVKVAAKFARVDLSCNGGLNCPSHRFTDVDPSAWYHEEVDYAVRRGLMEGVSHSSFAPNTSVSRGMVATVFHRLEGEPAVTGDSFTDVGTGKYYAAAVSWAAANGVVRGYGDSRFGPEDEVTREQFAAMLYRYAAYKGYDVTLRGDLDSFADAGQVSSYAVDALTWAVAREIVNGTGAATLSPAGQASRAQLAAMLARFCEAVAK